jgi:hypothetical protein
MKERKDLICLVADKDIEEMTRALLQRHQALDIRPLKLAHGDVKPHPERDPGCRLRAPEFLRPYHRMYDHALVIFDREGSGSEAPREEIESDLEKRLSENGWDDRGAAVVIDPEVEAWVWSESPHVDSVLGWTGRSPSLRAWLTENAFLESTNVKPSRPKEAMDGAIRKVGKPHSASLFKQLAEKVSVSRCEDPSFSKLREILKIWFPMY